MAVGKRELVLQSDEVWERIRPRVDGLTDDEYFWEPVPGCWTIRQRADGRWTADGTLPRPEPEPFTTIAWRLWHLIDMYGEDRAPRWLDVPAHGEAIGLDSPDPSPPSTAAAAVSMLDAAHDRWDAHLAQSDDQGLAERVGKVGGQYADRTRAEYVLHMLDEFIHHGAEIGLLRDQWLWRESGVVADPVVERVIRGDLSVLAEFADQAPSADLVGYAAAYGRWDVMVGLLERGAPVSTAGRTPLHLAAGAGELDVVKVLLDHGADISARDPEFHATPSQWADFLRRPNVAAYLSGLG